jgi:hypothetical protein
MVLNDNFFVVRRARRRRVRLAVGRTNGRRLLEQPVQIALGLAPLHRADALDEIDCTAVDD